MAKSATTQAARGTARAEKTRTAILAASERLFAEHGFDATRLEDVALAVGIKRASIVYYFRDKRALYDAVLASILGDLFTEIRGVLESGKPVPELIENAVACWVDYVAGRPAFARILLREIADASSDRRSALLSHIRPFQDSIERFLAERDTRKALPHNAVDPAHIASTIAGSTIFFIAAMPALVPDLGFDPLRDEALAAHRSEVLRITRRLLGPSSDDRS